MFKIIHNMIGCHCTNPITEVAPGQEFHTQIDTDEKYNLAKQLLQANKELKVRGGLAKDFFRMSSPLYQKKFWLSNLLFSIQMVYNNKNI